MDQQFTFSEAPPPKAAPRYPDSEALGLILGLRSEAERDGGWRCACCCAMQRNGATLVWIPDGVSIFDPPWSVTEMARQGAFNGSGSGWCLRCARLIGQPWRLLLDWRAVIIIGAFGFVIFQFVR